jgi:hypothetical protein
LIDNIQQDFSGVDFPFLWLDPNLSWHAGFQWWEKNFELLLKCWLSLNLIIPIMRL